MWAIGRYTKVSHRPVNSIMRRELHALGEGADDQRRGDRREGELEGEEGHFGNRHALREGVGGGLAGDAGEERLGEAADDRAEAAAVPEVKASE